MPLTPLWKGSSCPCLQEGHTLGRPPSEQLLHLVVCEPAGPPGPCPCCNCVTLEAGGPHSPFSASVSCVEWGEPDERAELSTVSEIREPRGKAGVAPSWASSAPVTSPHTEQLLPSSRDLSPASAHLCVIQLCVKLSLPSGMVSNRNLRCAGLPRAVLMRSVLEVSGPITGHLREQHQSHRDRCWNKLLSRCQEVRGREPCPTLPGVTQLQ